MLLVKGGMLISKLERSNKIPLGAGRRSQGRTGEKEGGTGQEKLARRRFIAAVRCNNLTV